MPILLLGVVLFLPVLFVLLLPFSIVQRYRAGTARRVGRPWLARLNFVLVAISAALFAWAAALTTFWVPRAFPSALGGLLGGSLLGLLGLKLTRWEPTERGLHYTPHRLLVLTITVVVMARVFYGFWRGWHAWHRADASTSWLAASGAAGSIAMGGIVLGYYLTYWLGISRRLRARGQLKVIRVR